jgi:hypothetical protein
MDIVDEIALDVQIVAVFQAWNQCVNKVLARRGKVEPDGGRHHKLIAHPVLSLLLAACANVNPLDRPGVQLRKGEQFEIAFFRPLGITGPRNIHRNTSIDEPLHIGVVALR